MQDVKLNAQDLYERQAGQSERFAKKKIIVKRLGSVVVGFADKEQWVIVLITSLCSSSGLGRHSGCLRRLRLSLGHRLLKV